MNSRILDIHRRSGDATLGATLLRLARMAEASHRTSGAIAALSGLSGSDSQRAAANGPGPVVRPAASKDAHVGGATAHTEVRR